MLGSARLRSGVNVPDLIRLQASFKVPFRDPELLRQALVHSSYLHEHPRFSLPSNERLEFLGDALLGLVVAEHLFARFPLRPEGDLTRLRAALVAGESLAQVAEGLGLGHYLSLGKGEEQTGGRSRPANLAGVFEALLGAVFLDRGYRAAKALALRSLRPQLRAASAGEPPRDDKSLLQELSQARYKMAPSYRTVEAAGPNHARNFTVEVCLGAQVLAQGSGSSKRRAEQAAARAALAALERAEGLTLPSP